MRSLRGFRHRLWTFYRVHAKSAAGFFTHRPRGLLVFYCGLRGLRVDFARNPHRLRGLRMYSWWTLYARSPCGLSVFYCGLHRLQADSVQTPHGLRRLVADSKYSVDPAWTQRIPFGLNRLPRTPCGIHVDFVRTPVDVRRSPRTLQKQKKCSAEFLPLWISH